MYHYEIDDLCDTLVLEYRVCKMGVTIIPDSKAKTSKSMAATISILLEGKKKVRVA
jgi:hypothetical protein